MANAMANASVANSQSMLPPLIPPLPLIPQLPLIPLPPTNMTPTTSEKPPFSISSIHTQEKSPFLASGNMPFGKPPPTQLLAPELRIEDKTYDLKDGWGKRVTQRTSGSSMGKFDVYLTNPISTKRLRSIPELLKFIKDNPHCPIGKYIRTFIHQDSFQ
jgi:hypothetical protein